MDAASAWQEFRHNDGRLYYYNSVTKATQWTKPPELMNPTEVSLLNAFSIVSSLTTSQRALLNQPWKEYTAQGGRKYWYNEKTQKSVWEMPEEFKDALAAGQHTH